MSEDREPVNSFGLMVRPDDIVAFGGGSQIMTGHRPWTLRAKYKRMAERLAKMADGSLNDTSQSERYQVRAWLGGSMMPRTLCFRSFDDMAEWAREKLGIDGWTVDRFGGWVPAGDYRAKKPGPLTPCTEFECARPAKPGETLCGPHAAGKRRSDATMQAYREKWAARDKERADTAAAEASAKEWAERIADEFGVRTSPVRGTSGEVAVSPEGLYSLLAQVRADAGWIIEELPIELQVRPDRAEQEGPEK